MENEGGLVSWLLSAVGAAFVSLAAAVAMLWKLNEAKNAKDIAELKANQEKLSAAVDECEADRADLRIKLSVLETRLAVKDKGSGDVAGR